MYDSMGFPGGSRGKEPPATAGDVRDMGLIPAMEKGVATHSSILAWRKSHGQKSLVGYSPEGHKESAMTEVTEHACTHM